MEIWKQHRPWSANTPADHYVVLGRTIAGQNQGRRFKAFSANETQRVRTECFVRMLSFRQELNFERMLILGQELNFERMLILGQEVNLERMLIFGQEMNF